MAFLDQAFDVSDLPVSTGSYDPVPEGNYDATISQAELKTTNDGSGQYIKLRLDITGPSHQGRVIFSNLNIKNASAKAEEIGRQQLGEIMRAIGIAKVQDTDQLIGGSVNIKVTIRAARTDEKTGKAYAAGNEVKGFRAIGGASPAPAATAAKKPATVVNKSSTPPWIK